MTDRDRRLPRSDGRDHQAATESALKQRLLAPGCGLALLILFTGLWLFDRGAYFGFMALWGVPAFPYPFKDWEAVVSIMHCAHRGVNVYTASQCGIFSYSPLWFWARWIPAEPVWRDCVGLAIDTAFFTSLWFVFRPRSWREAAVFTLACVSPAAAYAAERANADVILFLMIVPAVGLACGGPLRRALAYLVIMVAGLLKFYPMAALFIALRETTRRLLAVASIALVALAAVLFAIRNDLTTFAAGIPGGQVGLDAFGAPNVLYLLLGRTPSPVAWALSIAIVGVCSLAISVSIARGAGLARAMDRLDDRDRLVLTIGAAIVVGCFFAGQSIAYRAIFLIPVVAGLIALRRTADDGMTRTRLAWLAAGAITLMWTWAAQALFYPHYQPIPAFLILIRELVWWWVVTYLAATLIIFAANSEALAFLPRRMIGWVKISADV